MRSACWSPRRWWRRARRRSGDGGLLKGSELAQVFASLRANDLIWPYVVKGYLKGKPPPAFDLLYWNSDDTNLPGPMFCWYVRNTYLENKLREPGAHRPVRRAGRPRPASTSRPSSTRSKEDHIVPWKTAYASTQLLSRRRPFVLGASGHIAGVINPPAKNKRNYWIDTDNPPDGRVDPRRPGRWFEAAEQGPGQLVAGLGRLAGPHSGRRCDARTAAGQRRIRTRSRTPPAATSSRRRPERQMEHGRDTAPPRPATRRRYVPQPRTSCRVEECRQTKTQSKRHRLVGGAQ